MNSGQKLGILVGVLVVVLCGSWYFTRPAERKALPVPSANQAENDKGRVWEPREAGKPYVPAQVNDDPAARNLPAGEGPSGAAAVH